MESNSVIPVVMGSCWFGDPLCHIRRKVVRCVEEVELWAPSSVSCPSGSRGGREYGGIGGSGGDDRNRHGESCLWARDHLKWM